MQVTTATRGVERRATGKRTATHAIRFSALLRSCVLCDSLLLSRPLCAQRCRACLQQREAASLRDHPIGTGPYKFVSFAVDDNVTLTAFPDYFRGKPANDGIVLKVVPDEIMRALELRKGSVDMVVNDLSPDVIYQLAA